MATEAVTQAVRNLSYSAPKQKQLEVVESFISGHDVFGVLPTGFGKSLCYARLPGVFDIIQKPKYPSSVIIVTPLVAIMKDQVESWSKRGLSVAAITSEAAHETKTGVRAGDYQLVFFTPELLITKAKWRDMLLSVTYQERMKAFVVDEAHCINKWGDSFRQTLKRIGELRSLLPTSVHIMAFTATATTILQKTVEEILSMENVITVATPPCKPNIMYSVGTYKSMRETFSPLLERLRKERQMMPRIIVYCHSYDLCADLYIFLKSSLGGEFTEPPCADDVNTCALANMFLSCTFSNVKSEIICQFTEVDGPLRIVFAMSSFGLGVDCPNIRQVIHVGVPEDTELYLQEVGRAGRDMKASLALLLKHSKCNRYADKEILKYQDNADVCRRDFLFRDIPLYVHVDLGVKCLCCDICAKSCMCGLCESNYDPLTFVGVQL